MRKNSLISARGFTLLEMIIVIIIVGLTSTLGLVVFTREFERRKGEEAEMNLIVIYNAQKRYKLTHGSYFTCPGCKADEIDRGLNIVILSNNFNFTIEESSANAGGYRASARRKGGICGGKNAWVNDTDSTVHKECSQWK
jgi:prepilin-type N-terminal cleavage/methylation domain-containing protein